MRPREIIQKKLLETVYICRVSVNQSTVMTKLSLLIHWPPKGECWPPPPVCLRSRHPTAAIIKKGESEEEESNQLVCRRVKRAPKRATCINIKSQCAYPPKKRRLLEGQREKSVGPDTHCMHHPPKKVTQIQLTFPFSPP